MIRLVQQMKVTANMHPNFDKPLEALDDMNNHERHLVIKHQLEFRGVSFSKIARELGITHTTVLAVSNGRSRSKRVEAAIAGALDVTPSLLWPERYEEGYDG